MKIETWPNPPEERLEYTQPTPNTFGSSRFLTRDEVHQLQLNEEGEDESRCPYLGTLSLKVILDITVQGGRRTYPLVSIYARTPIDPYKKTNNELKPSTGNIITFGTTRSGKGTGQIIPNLLSWNGSIFVLDIKGENYLRSAGYRASLSQNVFRFAPFEQESHIWNPIKSIRVVTDWEESHWNERCQEEEDTRYLANLIIVSSGSRDDQFWEAKAKSLLVGLLLHVGSAKLNENTSPETSEFKQHEVQERSMREITRLIALNDEDFNSLLEDMSKSKRMLVRHTGHSFQGYLKGEGKLGESIKAMLTRHLDVWAYERVHRATYKPSDCGGDLEPGTNDFDFSQMRDGNTSIYLIIPPEYLSEYRSVMRVLIGCAIRDLKNSYTQSKTVPEWSDKPPVLFLLDEFAQLAHMSPIEEGLAYLAGYNVRLWFFLQDINQLKANYPDSWESFLANTEYKSFFGVNDINTAKLVSDMTGIKTVKNLSNTSSSVDNNLDYNLYFKSNNFSITVNHTGRALMTPDEVLHMHPDKQIVFTKSLFPLYLDLPKYHESPEMVKKSDLPPPQKIDFI